MRISKTKYSNSKKFKTSLLWLAKFWISMFQISKIQKCNCNSKNQKRYNYINHAYSEFESQTNHSRLWKDCISAEGTEIKIRTKARVILNVYHVMSRHVTSIQFNSTRYSNRQKSNIQKFKNGNSKLGHPHSDWAEKRKKIKSHKINFERIKKSDIVTWFPCLTKKGRDPHQPLFWISFIFLILPIPSIWIICILKIQKWLIATSHPSHLPACSSTWWGAISPLSFLRHSWFILHAESCPSCDVISAFQRRKRGSLKPTNTHTADASNYTSKSKMIDQNAKWSQSDEERSPINFLSFSLFSRPPLGFFDRV